MKKIKIWEVEFEAEEKWGKNKWEEGIPFKRRVSAKNYSDAIKKAHKIEFVNQIVNDRHDVNDGLPIKYRKIEVLKVEKVAEED